MTTTDLALQENHLLRQFLKTLTGRRSTTTSKSQDQSIPNVLRPDAPFFAVGDIHGRLDLVADLVAKIDPDQDQNIVFLGDYVDRGPDSAGALRFLYELAQHRPNQIVCLMGNHEKMMCEFIDDPLDRGARWLRNGGLATLTSYGIANVGETPTADQAIEACDALEAALPAGVAAWLRSLPLSWNSGNIWCVHAAMDPELAPDGQRSNTLLWGNRAFLDAPRQDGICVIHGHTIVDRPSNMNSRIAIDTCAYKTGRLTAAYIAHGHCEFINT
jgi:serine/threonine protein phosphatase 1